MSLNICSLSPRYSRRCEGSYETVSSNSRALPLFLIDTVLAGLQHSHNLCSCGDGGDTQPKLCICWPPNRSYHMKAEQLVVSQQAVPNRPREMGNIQKCGRWLPLELNAREMEKSKNTRHFARSIQKEILFASYIYRGWKVDLFLESPAQKSRVDAGVPPTSTAKPSCVGRKTMLCVWWDKRVVID